jgi:hypothetical protein
MSYDVRRHPMLGQTYYIGLGICVNVLEVRVFRCPNLSVTLKPVSLSACRLSIIANALLTEYRRTAGGSGPNHIHLQVVLLKKSLLSTTNCDPVSSIDTRIDDSLHCGCEVQCNSVTESPMGLGDDDLVERRSSLPILHTVMLPQLKADVNVGCGCGQ